MILRKYIYRIMLCCICSCVFISAHAQKPDELHLWPGKVPNETAVKKPAIITNDTTKHIIRVTEVSDPLIKKYPASTFNNNGAAIIICPGGGFKFLAFDLEGEEIAGWLNALGFNAYVLQYRVPKNEVGALQDIQRAVKLVRANATVWNLDTSRIGVMGFSAGGNLAARASTNFKRNTYTPVDKTDSLSCRPDFSIYIYPGSLSTGDDRHVIPEINVDKDAPTAFFFAANDDQYNFPYSFVSALHYAKVPVEMHVVPKGGHGYGLRPGNPAAETWPGLLKKWLQQFYKPTTSLK